jgi:hypothetical protein
MYFVALIGMYRVGIAMVYLFMIAKRDLVAQALIHAMEIPEDILGLFMDGMVLHQIVIHTNVDVVAEKMFRLAAHVVSWKIAELQQ